MRAIVDQEACVGCALCVDTCPVVFAMGDNIAKVISGPVPDGDEGSCRAAVDACAVEAITLDET